MVKIVLRTLCLAFAISSVKPQYFDGPINLLCLLAKGRTQCNVRFYLFNRADSTLTEVDPCNMSSMINAGFQYYKQTQVFVPGFGGQNSNPCPQAIQEAVTCYTDWNWIIAQYNEPAGSGSDPLAYFDFAADDTVSCIATTIAEAIKCLVTKFCIQPCQIQLLGHSLGAHICGVAAEKLHPDIIPPLIIGLDPAAPCFTKAPTSKRLDPCDAPYVIVYHTSSSPGNTQQLGCVDLFFNGLNQPGCSGCNKAQCNHIAACNYYALAIRNASLYVADKTTCLQEALSDTCPVCPENEITVSVVLDTCNNCKCTGSILACVTTT